MGTGDETHVSAYPRPATGSPNFPDLEVEVLDYWHGDGTFRASIDRRDGAQEYVFYDGPPFANGLPHYGHLLTGYVKDIVPRYRTMRGYKVERRFGWDTHGLPAELEVQRQLGIVDKAQIEAMGIEAFNDACRASVMKYADEWRAYVTRQARWVDFDDDYKTLDPTFMESVLWAFKQLYDKGLAYEGNRVLPYCWNDETPLSSHELRMDDDVYQNRQDPAVTVGLRVVGEGELAGAYLVVWTTTPWTLPSNQAVAVNPDMTYVHIQGADGRRYLLAEARVAAYSRELGEEPTVVGSYSGADLLGVSYVPPFAYFMNSPNAFRVLPGDFVTTDEGTGIVHMAPAYGEDDKATADAAGIVAVTPVDSKGRFDASVPDYEGQHVFAANPHIVRALKNSSGPAAANGAVLLRHETYDHSYPHCWRCRNPLIYRAVSSWFIEVAAFRDRMVELNEQITWYPEHVKDGQFGKWLRGARDWSISRNRYWGSPIPVWKSDDPAHPRIDVYGSLDDLERDFGVRPTNLHRPYIDDLTRPNPDDPSGNSTMRRIEDVLDVWFDSGSMPFAQVHYPFESQEWFDGPTGNAGGEAHFPGDFIVEYIGQTRGWFYTLHVLATALFDKPAFRTCVAHGIVLGSDGQKMSKSLRNYPDVSEVFDRDGSDAMRWFLMASPILRGGNLVVTEQGIREGVRQVLLPFWNAYSFLSLYAPQKGTWRTDSTNVLDRYVLAKLAALRDELTASLEVCDISVACEQLRQFTEALTNWYVRRSRSRFWDEDRDAIDTLHTVLEVTARLAAPLLPLITEVVWRGVTGERSVHLTDWPDSGEVPADSELVVAMDQVRDVCSVASSLRKAKKLRVRLPLSKLTVAVHDPEAVRPFVDLIADELNVKSVEITDDVDAYGRFELAVNAKVAGPRLGKDVQTAIKAVKAGQGVVADDGTLVAGPVTLQPGEYTSKLVAAEPEWTAPLPDGAGLVVLDGTLTPELEAEGWAKDRIRELQDLRKSSGLDVSDRISVTMFVPPERRDWAGTHAKLIAGEVLATSFEFGEPVDGRPIGDGVLVSIVKA